MLGARTKFFIFLEDVRRRFSYVYCSNTNASTLHQTLRHASPYNITTTAKKNPISFLEKWTDIYYVRQVSGRITHVKGATLKKYLLLTTHPPRYILLISSFPFFLLSLINYDPDFSKKVKLFFSFNSQFKGLILYGAVTSFHAAKLARPIIAAAEGAESRPDKRDA